jgi:RNA polymerase sigma-70 factor (ECF subfamily)
LADEQETIQRLKRHDESAFRELVTEYEAQIRATIVNMLGYSLIVDDIIQDVFIRFYKAVGNFKGDSKLSTYLTKIAINLSLNEIKRRGKRSIVSLDDIKTIDHYRQTQDTSESFATKELVQQALLLVDELYRSVIVLRIIRGYSTSETAKILELPEGTVLSRLARGQKKMYDIINKLNGDLK